MDNKMTTYNVTVQRDGRFWFIEIPELDGATQARTLTEVEEMARDYIAAVQDVDPASFDLAISISLPAEVKYHLAAAQQVRETEAKARTEAAREWAQAALTLKDDGLTVRDVGIALGISYQRAQQLVSN